MFRRSFIQFLEKEGVEYSLRGDAFLFKKGALEVILIPKGVEVKGDIFEYQGDGGVVYDRLYLYEDRWMSGGDVLKKRILSRMGYFESVFARKCEVVSGGKIAENVSRFLDKYHSYGRAKCKYRYALMYKGEMVAAATFSSPRPMPREDGRTYLSFEWVRYASVSGMRVVGGMGKLLKSFVEDALVIGEREGMPIEIMSYSDNEWSSGDVYNRLGFRKIGERDPVRYFVDSETYTRYSLRKYTLLAAERGSFYEISNQGSKKFLLTL